MEYRGRVLDPFQAEAIEFVAAGHSVLVSAPTGTGKTIIADFIVDQAIAEGRQVVYTAPIKALSNQKYRDYTRLHGRDNIGLVTGDLVINQDAPVRIMTTEILRNILLQGGRAESLSHVIIDEIHFLDDPERGTVWEELLIYLPRSVKILGLSATLPNIDEFAAWLTHVRGEDVKVVKEDRRAVPLKMLLANRASGLLPPRDFDASYKVYLQARQEQEGAAGGGRVGRDRAHRDERDHRRGRGPERGRRDRRDGSTQEQTHHADLILLLRRQYLPLLYFVFSRRQAEAFARDLSRKLRGPLASEHDIDAIDAHLRQFETEEPGVLTDEHKEMYQKGVAFHHAGLHVNLKALVEEMYEQKLIQVLYCTSTFALGINMPARTVVFDSIRKFNGQSVLPLTVRQFMQKAGRAGRRGMDTVGFVVVKEEYKDYDQDRPFLQRYHRGEHEHIESSFNLSFSSIVNLLSRYNEEEIRQILDKSFLNFRDRMAVERERERLIEQEREMEELARSAGNRMELKRLQKKMRRAERNLQDEGRLYRRYADKVDFLKRVGYIAEDNTFNAGARALLHIQIEEIYVTELVLSGLLEDTTEDELFGILTGLVQDLPRSVNIKEPMRGRWAQLRDKIKAVRDSEVVREAEELQGLAIQWAPELMPFGHMWAEGKSLATILLLIQSETDVSGDLVGAFRRAKDLASQLRKAFDGDEHMTQRLTKIMKKVSRDEVEVVD